MNILSKIAIGIWSLIVVAFVLVPFILVMLSPFLIK